LLNQHRLKDRICNRTLPIRLYRTEPRLLDSASVNEKEHRQEHGTWLIHARPSAYRHGLIALNRPTNAVCENDLAHSSIFASPIRAAARQQHGGYPRPLPKRYVCSSLPWSTAIKRRARPAILDTTKKPSSSTLTKQPIRIAHARIVCSLVGIVSLVRIAGRIESRRCIKSTVAERASQQGIRTYDLGIRLFVTHHNFLNFARRGSVHKPCLFCGPD